MTIALLCNRYIISLEIFHLILLLEVYRIFTYILRSHTIPLILISYYSGGLKLNISRRKSILWRLDNYLFSIISNSLRCPIQVEDPVYCMCFCRRVKSSRRKQNVNRVTIHTRHIYNPSGKIKKSHYSN